MFSFRNFPRRLEEEDGKLLAYLTSCVIAALFLFLWLPGMFKPLALDETGSLWVASGGVTHIVERAILFPQSILYCYLLWALGSVFGNSLFVLRVPSLIAAIFTLVMLYRMGGRVLGFKHRFLLPLLWMLITPFFLPPEARPYSIAMCIGVAALSVMESLLNGTYRLWQAALIPPLAAYCSFLFLMPLAGYGLFLLWLALSRKIRPGDCAIILTAWMLAVLPLSHQILASSATAALHSVPNPIHYREELFQAFLPVMVTFGVVAALVAAAIFQEPLEESRINPQMLVLAVLVAAAAIVPFNFITYFTSTHLWTAQYLSLAYAPLAIVYAAILVRSTGPAARLAAVLIPALFLLAASLKAIVRPDPGVCSTPRTVAALEQERRGTGGRIYLLSSFVEGWTWRFPAAEHDKELLLGPFNYYRLSPPYEILPHTLTQGSQEWGRDIQSELQREPVVIVSGPEIPAWIVSALASTHTARWVDEAAGCPIVTYTHR